MGVELPPSFIPMTRQNDDDIDRHICICVENLDNNSLSRNYWLIKHFFFPSDYTKEMIEDELMKRMYEYGKYGTWERQVYYPPQGIKAVIMDVVP